MSAVPIPTVQETLDRQDAALLAALEAVIAQLEKWKAVRVRLETQIRADFALPRPFPTEEELLKVLQHFTVFGDAIQQVAKLLEAEVEAVTDQYHTWFYD